MCTQQKFGEASVLGMLLHPLCSSIHLVIPNPLGLMSLGSRSTAEVVAKPYLEGFVTV